MKSALCCSICSELRLGDAGELRRTVTGIVNAVLSVNQTYAIIPSVGALVSGHSLIVPLKHQTAFLAEAEEYEIVEAMQSCQPLLGVGESLLMFEHGSSADDPTVRCGTSHAHLHVLPLNVDLHAPVLDIYPVYPMAIDELRAQARRFASYVAAFTWHEDHGQGWIVPAAGLPSQLMRQRIAATLGLPSWDWKKDPRSEMVQATIDLGFRSNVAVIDHIEEPTA
jgi:hypothetical protein